MNPKQLQPYTIDHHSITIIELAKQHNLTMQQTNNLLKYYNNHKLNLSISK